MWQDRITGTGVGFTIDPIERPTVASTQVAGSYAREIQSENSILNHARLSDHET